MITVRRIYVLLVCAISLHAFVWAIIALLRNLLVTELNAPKSTIAWQTAVILVGLPIFLVHWLWAQRLANHDAEERTAILRRVYLVGMFTTFLGPFAANAFGLLQNIFFQLLAVERPSYSFPVRSIGSSLIYYGAAMFVLAIFGAYQWYMLRQDARRQQSAETIRQALVRRVYIYAFAAVGLGMTISALVMLLRWLAYQFGADPTAWQPTNRLLATELSRLLVGLMLWLPHWLWAQRLFAGGTEAERESVLRKAYLYTAVFLGTVVSAATATALFAGLFSRLLNAPSSGDIRDPLTLLLPFGVVWAYHATCLQSDAQQSAEQPEQLAIRRLYHYLVAGVGLVTLLIGLGGILTILIFTLDGEPFIGELRQALAWFIAAIIAGLIIWLWPWRQVQMAASAETTGPLERQLLARKIYLYLFIFLATMTVLGTAVYIVSQLVELLLGSRATTDGLRDLANALAFSLLAIAIWLYHGVILREDGRAARREQRSRISTLHVAILSGDQSALMDRIRQGLQQKLPDLHLDVLPDRSATEEVAGDLGGETAVLATANIIISPATLILPNGQARLAAAMVESPARKMFVPVFRQDYLWLGMEKEDEEDLTTKAAQLIEQIAAGGTMRPMRKLGGLGSVIALVVGGLILLLLLFLFLGIL